MANPAFIPSDAESGRTMLQPGIELVLAVMESRQAASPTARMVRADVRHWINPADHCANVRALMTGEDRTKADASVRRASFWQAIPATECAGKAV